jgi:hypothetical protein
MTESDIDAFCRSRLCPHEKSYMSVLSVRKFFLSTHGLEEKLVKFDQVPFTKISEVHGSFVKSESACLGLAGLYILKAKKRRASCPLNCEGV